MWTSVRAHLGRLCCTRADAAALATHLLTTVARKRARETQQLCLCLLPPRPSVCVNSMCLGKLHACSTHTCAGAAVLAWAPEAGSQLLRHPRPCPGAVPGAPCGGHPHICRHRRAGARRVRAAAGFQGRPQNGGSADPGAGFPRWVPDTGLSIC